MSDREWEVFDCFVKLPDYDAEYSGEFRRSVHVVQREEMGSDELVGYVERLRTLTRFYEDEGNPYYAVMAFCLSRQHGYFPPKWVMDFLNNSFEGFLKSKTINIESWMGLQGKSGATARKKAIAAEHDYTLFTWILMLHKVNKVSVKKAAEMVHRRASNADENHELSEYVKKYSPETIEQYYMSKWKKWRKGFEGLSPNSWSEIKKDEFLRSFT